MEKLEINETEFSTLMVRMIIATMNIISKNPMVVMADNQDMVKIEEIAKEFVSEIIPEAMEKYMAQEDKYFDVASKKMEKDKVEGIERLIKKIIDEE